jgi:hypothetical protein
MIRKDQVLSLDLEGFSEDQHLDVALFVRRYCPELEVVESDIRHIRPIDRATFQVSFAGISATCALIGLAMLANDKLAKNEASKPDQLIDGAIASLESECGLKIPRERVVEIMNCVSNRKSELKIQLPLGNATYELVVKADKLVYARGHIVISKRPAPSQKALTSAARKNPSKLQKSTTKPAKAI